jgi:poly [ADP-ribose] polymerase
MEIIGKYSDRIDELRNLKLAYTAVNDSTNVDQEAQYENLYKSLKTSIVPIDRDTSIWKIIEDYVLKTHGHTHTNTCRVKIENIYEITRESDANRDYPGTLNNSPDQNLQLLWHGTRLTNFISILQNGLVLRPELISNAKITGKMFGNGIYAANSFSKSLNYCGFGDTNNDACLFLGEFVLGKQLEKTQSDSGLNEKILLSQGYHSTWAKGKDTPSSFTTISSSFDKSKLVRVPNGPLIASQIKSSLLYDEFIVYNEQQLRLRFIVQIKVL